MSKPVAKKKFPGIVVGYHPKLGYLIYTGQQFVLLAAPTRSGKGVALVIPNLLLYPDSVVVLDLKLENFKYTSKFRKEHGQEVFLFAPFSEDGKTHGWNMFDAVKQRPAHLWVGELLSIGETLYPSDVEVKTKFFNDNARNLFLAFGLYLLETPSLPCTAGEIFRQASGNGRPLKSHVKEILNSRAADVPGGAPALSRECVDAFNRFLSQPDTTLGNVLSTFNGPLLVFSDPIVDAATSRSDFDLGDVRKKRMSIYFGIQPNRLADAALLINLFFSQLINANLRELPQDNPELKFQCALFDDEFASIGRIRIIDKANPYIAGYNIRLVTIIQSVSQLEREELYGIHGTRTLVTNHGLQILFPPREHKDAKEYSDMLGYFTASSKSRGRSVGKSNTSSRNASDAKRALMMPQELKEMPQNQQIIIMENCKPILCEKAFFYQDPLFVDRLKALSPYLAALGKKMPSQDQLEHAAFVLGELSVPIIPLDVASLWARTSKAGVLSATRLRDVRADEMATLKASDFANHDDLKECLYRLLPGYGVVETTMADFAGAAQTA